GKMRHRGNAPAVGDDEGFTFDPELGANKTDLSRYFDVKDYLSPHSDIAALMVFEHQMYVQNAITRTSRGLRVLSESVESATEPLVDALLGYGEVTLSEPVIGSDVFRRDYEKSGARSGSRFNLRELDLTKRVYKYPISPMIESDSYKALPTAAKEYVRKRFGEIASAPGEKYSYLTESDFALLRDYLRSTSSGQP
ncbi:MAG TPA: hypothetical protein VJ835_11605, partial [Fimbriimonadaceae bacterium]|nr:hypothetical protein [Fimbriimonadaceae bacterium]